jgi:hypothetical protein
MRLSLRLPAAEDLSIVVEPGSGDGPLLPSGELPAAFHATDRASLHGQRRTVRSYVTQLVALLVAAVAGTLSYKTSGGVDLAALIAVAGFLVSLLVSTKVAQDRPEQRWYRGRAGAESIRTLSWAYAVGGDPFPMSMAPAEADRSFGEQLGSVLRGVANETSSVLSAPGSQLTEGMRALRAASLAVRKRAYEVERIEDQQRWYDSRASSYERRAERWVALILLLTMAGMLGAIVRVFGGVQVDLLGVASAAAASVTAWTQLKQYRALAAAYSLTALELTLVGDGLRNAQDEADWSRLVRDAEQAISREHTLWLARRSIPG